MKVLAIAALVAVVCACTSASLPAPPGQTFIDARFAPTAEPVDADAVFAMSDAMRRYVRTDIAPQLRAQGPQRGLISALYLPGQLKLDYDASITRNAAQAFEARRGNCLSLVIMTAAFAKEIGLRPVYQSIDAGTTWSRRGGIAFLNEHVNLGLRKALVDETNGYDREQILTVDFLPAEAVAGYRAQRIDEATIVSMYMNNRSAEALERGDIDTAYWWARGAIVKAPSFSAPYNTLAMVYLHHGDLAQAERVLADLLQRDPGDRQALSNLAMVNDRLGRPVEAIRLRERLADLEPFPPYHFFFLGTAAMARGDYSAARTLFAREVGRADYSGEFHFWLGVANLKLGDLAEARRQLAIAMENSTSPDEHALYEGKLQRLRSYRVH